MLFVISLIVNDIKVRISLVLLILYLSGLITWHTLNRT